MQSITRTALSILIAIASWAPATPPAKAGPVARPTSAPHIRARGDRFELVRGAEARPIFFRGVNLGAGAPGHFPGEFAFTKDDYRRYIRFARGLHANAIRVYALHPPAFYQALREENLAHPDRPLWLFQEVWTELPASTASGGFWDAAFTRDFEREIRLAVDALHGNAAALPRPGHASGRYDADVSPWLAGWLLGREWEPNAVRTTERGRPDSTEFRGRYFSVTGGTPMECWLARACETAASHEQSRYGLARAVSFVTWPTLDVMRHPTESERGGHEAEHDEDAYSVDPRRIRPIRAASRESGFLGYFANYHVYPYYPDFLNLDPGYAAFRDAHGPCSYGGYLRDLKAHTRGLPLLIGEFGVPSSRGVAHLQPQGINHGGATEREQGLEDVRLLEDVAASGCAGGLLFALFDEWFKVNWLVAPVEAPRERDPLWHNVLDPEENYGLMAFDPPPRIRVDGSPADWKGVPPYAADPRGRWIRALYAATDQTHLYLRFDLAPGAARGAAALGVAIDVVDPARGDTRLPAPLDASWSRGAEYQLVIAPHGHESPSAELFIDARSNWSPWSRVVRGGVFIQHKAPFAPVANEDGRYAPLLIETNRERVSRSGTVYPALHRDWGRLESGRDWAANRDAGVIEVAIPWGLIGVGDPSSRSVVDDDPATRATEVSQTPGIGFLAWATSAPGFAADSLGPARHKARPASPAECQFLGPPGSSQLPARQHVLIQTPPGATLVWNAWDRPITRERVKVSADLVRQAFEGMEARESEGRNQDALR